MDRLNPSARKQNPSLEYKRKTMTSKLVHAICDYAIGDQAYAEVLASIYSNLPDDVRVVPSSVPSCDTVSTGFNLAQLALAPRILRPEKTMVFANCAPRKDDLSSRPANRGEKLVYGITTSGVRILAVNSGYSLSFLKDHLFELYELNVEDKGSQFRSRDIFPVALGRLWAGDKSLLTEEISTISIPSAPESAIGYIDSFGNIKTTIRASSKLLNGLKNGDRLELTVKSGRCSRKNLVTFSPGSFSVADGETAFAPGSSGYDDRFFEIFHRGGSAAKLFGFPKAGAKLQISLAT